MKQHWKTSLRTFLACDRGATAIEYAMIAAGISIVIVGVVYEIGDTVETLFFNQVIAGFDADAGN